MSDTQLPISEYIKQGITIAIVIAIALFGIKTCRKFQKEKQIIAELTSHTNESAAYEQFYLENAQQNLLKAMFHMHTGIQLGNTPEELVAEIMNIDSKDLLSTDDASELPIRKALIRDALLSNYDNCNKLGIFDERLNINSLSDGEFPTISKGPKEGEKIDIRTIIPTEALPGAEKLLPNMVIIPPEDKSTPDTPSDFEIARAKNLAKQLATANLIEKQAYSKVLDYYKNLQNLDN